MRESREKYHRKQKYYPFMKIGFSLDEYARMNETNHIELWC